MAAKKKAKKKAAKKHTTKKRAANKQTAPATTAPSVTVPGLGPVTGGTVTTTEVGGSVGLDQGEGATKRLKIFKAEAHGDTMYVEAESLNEAQRKLTASVGEIPTDQVRWSEVDKLPEGETLMAEPVPMNLGLGEPNDLEGDDLDDDDLTDFTDGSDLDDDDLTDFTDGSEEEKDDTNDNG